MAMDERHKAALVIANLMVDYMKDTGQIERWLAFSVANLAKEGYDSPMITKMYKMVTDDIQRELHGKMVH